MGFQFLASTVRRTATRTWARGAEEAGELWQVELDVERRTLDVAHRVRLPNFHVSPLERFGGKGIAVLDDAIAVATYDTICVYDRSLGRLLAQRSHRLMGDLHSLSREGDLLYTTSPLANAILALDGDLNVVWSYFGHEDDELCRQAAVPDEARSRARAMAEGGTDYRFYTDNDVDLFHFNHHFFTAGELIVNVPPAGRLWNVTRGEWFMPQCLLAGGSDGAFHDGVYLPEQGHYLAHTKSGTVHKRDPRTGTLLASVEAIPHHQHRDAFRVGWLRGMAPVHGELFLAGQSGPSIGLVDFQDRAVLNWWSFGENRDHSFFALAAFHAAFSEIGGLRENGRSAAASAA